MVKKTLGLLFVFLLLAIGALFYIDPNQYKVALQTELSKQLGRDIVIHGNLAWQLSGGLAIEADDVVISDPKTKIKHLTMQLALKPLLQKQIVFEEIDLDQAVIHATTAIATSPLALSKSKSKPFTLRVERLSLQNSTIYYPLATGQKLNLTQVNLTAKNFGAGSLFPITFTAKADNGAYRSSVNFSGQTDLNKIKGNITLTGLTTPHMHWNKLAGHLSYQNNLLALTQLNGQLHGGKFYGNLAVNLQNNQPKITLDAQFTDLTGQTLFQDLIKTDRISGNANFTFNLTTQGLSPNALQQNLNGKFKFSFDQGYLYGVDIPYVMNVATALFKAINFTGKPQPGTAFEHLSGTGTITQGVIDNSDLLLTSNTHRVTGRGMINLNQEQVKYRILIEDPKADTAGLIGKLQGILGGSIPVVIRGSFQKLRYEPDMAAITRARAKLLIQAPIDTFLKEPVKGSKRILQGIKSILVPR